MGYIEVQKKNSRLKNYVFFILAFYSVNQAFAQNLQQVANSKGDELLSKVTLTDNPDNDVKLLKQASTWFEKSKNWDKYVQCLNFMAIAFYNSEQYDSCESVTLKAVKYSKVKLGLKSEGYKTALINLGAINDVYGNSDKAIQLYTIAIEISQDISINKLDLYYTLGNLGYSYNNLGDYDQAIACNKKAYEIAVDTLGEYSYEASVMLSEIAKNFLIKPQIDAALEYYLRSLVVLEKHEHKKYYEQIRWNNYLDIADIYFKKRENEKAFIYINKALGIQSHYNLQEDYKTWMVLGKFYQKENKFQFALENFNKQKTAAEVEYDIYANHPQVALAIANIASVYVDMQDYSTALQQFQTALQTIAVDFCEDSPSSNPAISQFVNKLDALEILTGKADALFKSYTSTKNLTDLQSADNCYLLIADLIQSIRQGYLAEGSKHTLSEKAVPLYEKAIEVVLELHKITGKGYYLEQAFSFAESNKAVLLFEGIRDQMAKGFAGIPDSLQEKESDLQAEITFYEKKILESQQKLAHDTDKKIKEWESKLFDLREQRNKLKQQLETQYPQYFSLKYQTGPANITDIRRQLKDDRTALVEYMLGPENGYAFFLTKKDLLVYKIENKGGVEVNLSRLREVLSSPPTSDRFATVFADFSKNSSALYASLLLAGLDKLGDGIERLVIVPDDLLNYLPFEVLLRQPAAAVNSSFAPKNVSYLFEDYAISYHYSATLLANSTKFGNEPLSFIGYAPSFGESIARADRSCTGGQLSSLACNRQEVQAISDLWQGKAVLSDAASTKDFLQEADRYGILHLATHACIDESAPGLNKIFFSDDYLSQLDLDQLHLTAALTVLSACNTGTGKIQRGEGVMSMARSFLLAGSASVLTSLWAVDDCTTSDIMLRYYQFLKKGMDKDEALQNARLAYLKSADAEGSHPYYWAAFVQFGDTGALEKKGGLAGLPMPVLLGTGAALLGLFGFLFLKKRKPHSLS